MMAPFHIGDRYAPQSTAFDRIDHIGMTKSVGEALAHQCGFLQVHAVGDVDRQHKFHIDRTLRRRCVTL